MKYLIILILSLFVFGCSENPVNQPVVQKDNISQPVTYPITIEVTDIYDRTETFNTPLITYELINGAYFLNISDGECGVYYPIKNIKHFIIY